MSYHHASYIMSCRYPTINIVFVIIIIISDYLDDDDNNYDGHYYHYYHYKLIFLLTSLSEKIQELHWRLC